MQKYLDLKTNSDFEKLRQPAEIIKKGGIVIFLSSIERLKYEDCKLTYSHLDYPKAREEVS